MHSLQQHFPHFTGSQLLQFEKMEEVYAYWNERINVISRKDMEHFYERHVLHSLTIAKLFEFKDGMKILDLGTGGGFPGIPLAIAFPEVHFHLVDSIGKKINVVKEVVQALGLKNVTAEHIRVEEVKGHYDFVVTRAVARLDTLIHWVNSKIKFNKEHPQLSGLICLKGGDLTEEFKNVKWEIKEYPVASIFNADFYDTKKVIHTYPIF